MCWNNSLLRALDKSSNRHCFEHSVQVRVQFAQTSEAQSYKSKVPALEEAKEPALAKLKNAQVIALFIRNPHVTERWVQLLSFSRHVCSRQPHFQLMTTRRH